MAIKNRPSISYLQNSEQGMLKNILSRVESLQQLTRTLHGFLEPGLAEQCQVANWREGKLVIQVSNAAWATRLRFQQPEILSKLRQLPEYAGITGIEISLANAPEIKPKAPAQQARIISKTNARDLYDLAVKISNKALKDSLKKLSSVWLD